MCNFVQFVRWHNCTESESLELWQHLGTRRFLKMMKDGPPKAEVIAGVCPNCGETFAELKDGKIPTHDFPRPCRAVCRGSNQQPRHPDDKSLLWCDGGQ